MATMVTDHDVVAPGKWNLARRVAFRFVFLYSLLYLTPKILPIGSGLLEVVVNPVSQVLFDRPAQVRETGSGDTWFEWMWLLVVAAVAVAGALVWSVFDRRRPNYGEAWDALLVYLRFAVGFIILGYGVAKLWPIQFPPLSPGRLIEPVGALSPMGLMWTFMGHSPVYSAFAGAAEALGAVLLFFRRTSLLGALILIGVMANVAMLNLTYDVPVKQFSINLLAFCCVIAAPHAARLLRFLLDSERQRRRSLAVLGCVVAAILVSVQVFIAMVLHAQVRDALRATPFDGVYDVEELVRDGVVVPPLLSQRDRWRRVGIGGGAFTVLTVGDTLEHFGLEPHAETNGLTLRDAIGRYDLVVTRLDGGLMLQGTVHGTPTRSSLRRVDRSELPLTSRGFRWVQEQPFNR